MARCICTLPEPKPKKTADSEPKAKEPRATELPNRWVIAIGHTQTGMDDTLSLSAYPAPATSSVDADAKLEAIVPAPSASSSVSGEVNRAGYTVRYASAEAAAQAAAVLPPLADDMPADANSGLEAQRTWYGKQVWTVAPVARSKPEPRRRHTR